MGKGEGGGAWKYILIEVGIAVLAVVGKEVADRAGAWIAEKNRTKREVGEGEKDSKSSEKTES